ncbi:MAG TPA: hypothetical protein VN328_11325, partial [Thermodesulfovibrionales bacterium]|nr:hypothetical protein [Thermodesulfovibrionales bacterium]
MTRRPLILYVAGAASLATFAVYLSSLQHEFLQWDDTLHILDNPHIRSLDPAFFRWAFFDSYAGNWHPLTWMSHALDYAIWGVNPLGHHLTSNILHAINTFVVVLLVARLWEASSNGLSGSSSPSGLNGFIVAATTGLLFGLHPLHVESVAWVSERKDLLCALFFMMSVMMYLKYLPPFPKSGGEVSPPPSCLPAGMAAPPLKIGRGRGSHDTMGEKRWYLLSFVFFVLALLSKPMAVTLPAVLLIIDWHPLGRIQSFKTLRIAIAGKLPFIALSIISSVLTVFAQRAGGAIKSIEFAPLSKRVLVGVESVIIYLWKMILPLNLSPFYPYPEEASLLSIEYLSAIVLVLGITTACAVMAKRQKFWLSAWGYYVI